eukprot:535579_1
MSQQIDKIKKVIESSLAKLERMNVDVDDYLDILKDKFCNNDEKQSDENSNTISLLVDSNNKEMCPRGHQMRDGRGKCNQCDAISIYRCVSCWSYDRKYDANNWDSSYSKYRCCQVCSSSNAQMVKNKMEQNRKTQKK